MPPNWDEYSPRLRGNLTALLQEMAASAKAREKLSSEVMRSWHKRIMRGLGVPEKRFIGAFRGEPGLETIGVRIGGSYGVAPSELCDALKKSLQR